ncbi:MAG: hypothetical protein JZU63_13655, partial [Rhodoferax sp.]|nr:hypothetical protein [Rhodoferax sp.]
LCAGNCLVFGRVQKDIEAADVVIVVGTELSDTDLYNDGRALQFGGNVVRIDIDPDQINRRTTPTVGIVGDAAHTMTSLARGIVSRTATTGAQRAQQWRDHARAKTSDTFTPWLQVIERWCSSSRTRSTRSCHCW